MSGILNQINLYTEYFGCTNIEQLINIQVKTAICSMNIDTTEKIILTTNTKTLIDRLLKSDVSSNNVCNIVKAYINGCNYFINKIDKYIKGK